MKIENRKSKIEQAVMLLIAACLMLDPCAKCDAASARYERLEGLFLQGQFAAVVQESDALIRSGYGRKEDIYYLKGLSELKLKKFESARASFGFIMSKYPRSPRAFDASVGIGDSYMLAGELNAAVGAYNRVLDDFPSDTNISMVYSRLAECCSGLGLRDKADHYRAMAGKASPSGLDVKGQAIPAVARQAVPAAAAVPVRPAVSAGPDADVDLVLATGGSLSVQVGSFKNRRNAEKFARKLASYGYESRVEIPVAQENKFYRVKVGRVPTRAEAEALAARLRASGCNTKICDGEKCD